MKNVIIYSSEELGYGELREAEFAVVKGVVVKARDDIVGESVEEPSIEVTDDEVRVSFKRLGKGE